MGRIGVLGGLWGSDRGFKGFLMGFLGVPLINGGFIGVYRGFKGFIGVFIGDYRGL